MSEKYHLDTDIIIELFTKVTDLFRFREWFDNFEAKKWNNQFETDVLSGKLDNLAE